ncbi:MAG: bifunctional 4-hydroxy-2-oxoglutarate aldolase/2-dehydro-3-deoxy-phosphogluconate aldolase [Novosphingobium sp.]|nr:bifunctional 4-hydroxy-2-oxoglutarate aldolase/2-dehydro-3-deoxy-phosphogluconate aldolase [Novosphingobium sp.]
MQGLTIEALLARVPVIPLLVVDDPRHARIIAEALVNGGLPVIEVALRTPAALDVIRQMSTVKGAVVGAGTVLNHRDLEAAIAAGARFAVSPGLTEGLLRDAISAGVPYLPGVANASDIMRGLDMGLMHFKFFPAEASGGIAALKALGAAFGDVRFCPTGGITQDTASAWLGLPQVVCVAGSWVVPHGCVDARMITANAARAAGLAKSGG